MFFGLNDQVESPKSFSKFELIPADIHTEATTNILATRL